MAIAEMARHERTMPGIRRANASLTGPRAGRAPKPVRADRHDRTLGAPRRASAASTVPQRSGTAIVESVRPERGMASSRRANANLTGLSAGRAPQPARADRRDLRTRAVARAQTSNQDRRAQERATEIGRTAPAAALAAKAARRAAAPRQSGALARPEKDRRKAAAVRG